jgi:hypothetical protein
LTSTRKTRRASSLSGNSRSFLVSNHAEIIPKEMHTNHILLNTISKVMT